MKNTNQNQNQNAVELYMNQHTGSVDTLEQWELDSKKWEDEDAEEVLKSLIKVVRINNEWVEA